MKFSQRSYENLNSCHEDLQKVALEAIIDPPYDFGITSGHRTPSEQFELFKKGRAMQGNKWVKIGNVVTYKDGYIKKSKHNYYPAEAFDIVIYVNGRVTWNTSVYIEMSAHILDIADKLFEAGEITNQVMWGGNWHTLKDWCHYQI